MIREKNHQDCRIVQSHQSENVIDEKLIENNFFIANFENEDIEKITSFLMLTRLVDENILSIVKKDKSYEKYAAKLNLLSQKTMKSIFSIEDTSKIIFEELKKQKLTLRQLSEKTGLTQTMISQFKSGRDIRFSNLLKIIRALNLNLEIN